MNVETKSGTRFLGVFALFLSFFVFAQMCSLNPAYALDVTLAWDANTEPDLAGYGIYYGTESGDPYHGEGALEGDSPVDIQVDQDEDPDPDVVQFTLHDIPDGTYFFAVTAYNTKGLESDYSNEASSGDNEASTGGNETSTGDNQGSKSSGGGGHCFVAAAVSGSNALQRVTYLSLILLSAIVGLVPVIKNFRK